MQVVVIQQSLAPGVQHGRDADLGVKMVAPEFSNVAAHRVEQQAIEGGAVLLDQGIEFMRQREHQWK